MAVVIVDNSFQHLYFDGSLSLDATIMVSKNCPTISEHVVTIFHSNSITC